MTRTPSRTPPRWQSLLAWIAAQSPRQLAAVVVAAVALAAAVAGSVQGAGTAILVLAAAALGTAILAFWASLRSLFGDRPMSAEEAYGLATPRAEDEQKRAVLGALKDLEYEQSAGKISAKDYQALRARYRAEAQELLQLEQQSSAALLERVEQIIAAHLAKESRLGHRSQQREHAGEPALEQGAPGVPAGDEDEGSLEDDQAAAQRCPSCETDNDGDALFCKRCGRELGSPPSSEDDGES